MPVYRVAVHLTAVLRVPADTAAAAEQATLDGFPAWCTGPLFDFQLYAEALAEAQNHDLQPDDIIQIQEGKVV